MPDYTYDIAIIGGGILGLATAMELSNRYPRHAIGLLEKEAQLAVHQTGRNSGVIHSGIYYKPGSLKATNCIAGARALIEFCDEHEIRYDLCGKVIVATEETEMARLDDLYRRGTASRIQGLELIGPERLREIEPHAAGLKALYSPNTGIVDYTQVSQAYSRQFQENGGDVIMGCKVQNIRKSEGRLNLETTKGDVSAKHLINCAGLHADTIARMTGAPKDLQIIPFRGEYYLLSTEGQKLVNGLIYPVPDPELPFLGVHFTRTIHGGVEAGPNAVLALAREGYSKSKISLRDTLSTLSFPGFWVMSAKYWKIGIQEYYRSLNKWAFTKSLQKLVPGIQSKHLVRGGAGVRAQAVERGGFLVDDFRISQTENAIHIRNAPSPGATASLAISRNIVDMAEGAFGLRR